MFLKNLKIGGIEIKNKILLTPYLYNLFSIYINLFMWDPLKSFKLDG